MAKKFLDYDGLQTLVTQTKSAISTAQSAAVTTAGTNADSKIKAAVTDKLGYPSGIAPLNSDRKIDSIYLPGYVDDVLEFAGVVKGVTLVAGSVTESDAANVYLNSGTDKFVYLSSNKYYNNWTDADSYGESTAEGRTPATGKIYVDINTNKTYRYTGSGMVEISASLAIGTTTGSGNAVTGMTVSDGVINLTKDSTFLTGVTATTSGSGNVVSAVSASGGALTVTKGVTALTTATSTGSGNVVSAVSASGGTLTVTKGVTALTAVTATTSGDGNVVTGVTASGGALTVTKGSTAILSAATSGSGNVVTAASVSSGALTLTKGITALTAVTASTTGSGNAVTAITASGGALTVTKGTTFLTGVNSTVSGSGNAVTAISASSGTLTLTKGSTFALADGSNIDSITTSEITALFA